MAQLFPVPAHAGHSSNTAYLLLQQDCTIASYRSLVWVAEYQKHLEGSTERLCNRTVASRFHRSHRFGFQKLASTVQASSFYFRTSFLASSHPPSFRPTSSPRPWERWWYKALHWSYERFCQVLIFTEGWSYKGSGTWSSNPYVELVTHATIHCTIIENVSVIGFLQTIILILRKLCILTGGAPSSNHLVPKGWSFVET